MNAPTPQPHGLHAALIRNTGFLISRMGMVAQKGFAGHLESIGLTLRMWGALNVLDAEGPITQHALGRCVGVDPSSMVSTLDELEAEGLVKRRPHPSDRRAHALYVTPKGHRKLARGRELAKLAQQELLSSLSPAERGQLHELLLRLARANGGPAKPAT